MTYLREKNLMDVFTIDDIKFDEDEKESERLLKKQNDIKMCMKDFYKDVLRVTTTREVIEHYIKNGKRCNSLFSEKGLVVPWHGYITPQQYTDLLVIRDTIRTNYRPLSTITESTYTAIQNSRIGCCYYKENQIYRLCEECMNCTVGNQMIHACMMSKYWNGIDGNGILNLWTNEILKNNLIENNFVTVVCSYETVVKLSNYQYDRIVLVYEQNPLSFDFDFKKPFPPIPLKEQLKRQTYRLYPPPTKSVNGE